MTENMETILIQNFKAIKNTAKREIKVANLTILTGEQATGKSTVAKLVYFFKNLPEQILDELLTNSEINEQNFDRKINEKFILFFRHLFGPTRHLDNFEVLYRYSNKVEIKIARNQKNGNLIISKPYKVRNINYSVLQIYNEIDKLRENYDEFSRRERERLISQLTNFIRSIFGINQHLLYMPSSRNMAVVLEDYLLEIFSKMEKTIYSTNDSYDSESEYLLFTFIKYVRYIKNRFKLNGDFQQIFNDQLYNSVSDELFNELNLKISKVLIGQYRFDQYGEKIFYSENGYVYLNNSSSGQQESIRTIQDIFLEVFDARPVFRVYEEPESHLSPVGQLGIIQLIAMLANRNSDNQIIIPTHTPYLLYEISNMLRASEIAKNNPELKDEVSKILKPYYWLDLESVSAYQLNRDGEIEDALDLEYQMVYSELFDRVTNETSDQFDKLLKLQEV